MDKILHVLAKLKDKILLEYINFDLTKEVDIVIDPFTPCLEHRESGEKYPTQVLPMSKNDLSLTGPKNGWNQFDWGIYLNNPFCEVKKLTVAGDEQIQGLIAYEAKEGWVHIYLLESAPWNIKAKEFLGVGPHLFAIACKESFDLGYEGFVTFVAKTQLIEHYKKSLGALVLKPRERLMVIETKAAYQLVSTYFCEEGST